MVTIVTRSGKGSPLTNAEVDANFTNLNSGKVEQTRAVGAGAGITGGGDLSADRTLALTGQALALHNLASDGFIARTAASTVAARALTGTADQITITNGDGVSGNPVVAAVVASQAEAEAGVNTTKLMTPQRVSQAAIMKTGGTMTGDLTVPNISASGNVTVTGTVSMGSSFFRNRIINGDMRIDQRYAGAATPNTINGYVVDRWRVNQSVTGKVVAQQNAGAVTPPTGFTNYLGITSQSAYAVLAADNYSIMQNIEGFNVSDLGWGTASAQPVAVSFWVRSSLTGTHGAALRNSTFNRSYPFTFVINVANTWERKTVSIAGDTSGTWGTDNGVGISLLYNLGTGTTFSGAAGAWAAGNFVSATGAVSVVGINGATFYITGAQLEQGTVATPFERRQYGAELALCQRYYYVIPTGSYGFPCPNSGGYAYVQRYDFKVPMRVAPTISWNYGVFFNLTQATPLTVNNDYATVQYVGTTSTNTTWALNASPASAEL